MGDYRCGGRPAGAVRPPTLLIDVKLDGDSGGRPESELADFTLCDEVRRLLDRINKMESRRIQRIEVRAGIPRRVLSEARLAGPRNENALGS